MAGDDSDKGGTDVLDRPAPASGSWLEGAALTPRTDTPWAGVGDKPQTSIEDMLKPPPGVVQLQKDRTAAVTGEYQRQSGVLDQDQAIIRKRFAETGIEPGTLEPWDNNKMRERYRTDPLESFGSLGSVFAMIASAFTRAPMENALNGAAAAMNAIKEGNEKEFEIAHRAWKENTDLALKRHQIMQQQYENAIQLMSSDVTAGRAKMQMLAASYDDRQMLGLMEAGFWPQGLELMDKRNKVARDQFELKERMDETEFQRTQFKADQARNKEQYPDPKQRALADLMSFNRIYRIKDQSPQHALFAERMVERPNESTDERIEWAQKHGLLPQRFRGGNAATEQRMILADETIQQFEGETGEKLDPPEKNMIQQTFQDKTSNGALKTAALMAGLDEIRTRKANGEKIGPEERSKILKDHADRGEALRIKQQDFDLKLKRFESQQQQKETEHLTDDAIDRMARQYVEAGDTTVKQNIGAGASRGENLARLNQRITEIQKMDNVSPKEQAARIAKNIGEKQYQRTAGGYAARVEVATNEVAQIAPIALEASDKLARGKYVPVNTAIQMWQRGTSNETLTEFATNNFALKNAYVRAMNPTGVPRVQERVEAHADGLFRTATSPAAYRVMVQQMIREVQASKRAVQATRDENTLEAEMLKILNQKTPSGRASSAGSSLGGQAQRTTLPTIKTKAEYDKLESGTKFIDENGKEWTKQ